MSRSWDQQHDESGISDSGISDSGSGGGSGEGAVVVCDPLLWLNRPVERAWLPHGRGDPVSRLDSRSRPARLAVAHGRAALTAAPDTASFRRTRHDAGRNGTRPPVSPPLALPPPLSPLTPATVWGDLI